MKLVNIQTPGKWILVGEHSVLRGYPALVFPLFHKYFKISGYIEVRTQIFSNRNDRGQNLSIESFGENKNDLSSLFFQIWSEALAKLSLKKIDVVGSLKIENELPLGAGLGASAALCVSITKLLKDLELITEHNCFEFARSLENLFHGESSGVDIAVVLTQKPILFYRYKGFEIKSFDFFPYVTLHYTGQKGITRHCIDLVKKKFESSPDLGKHLDKKMEQSVMLALEAFENKNLQLLVQSLNNANDVFKEWGLIDSVTQKCINQLNHEGALAVKPTGSGLGGFILALWQNKEAFFQTHISKNSFWISGF